MSSRDTTSKVDDLVSELRAAGPKVSPWVLGDEACEALSQSADKVRDARARHRVLDLWNDPSLRLHRVSEGGSGRWKAVATYRTNDGLLERVHFVDEIEDLQRIIELGPDWNAVVDLRITLDLRTRPEDWTIE